MFPCSAFPYVGRPEATTLGAVTPNDFDGLRVLQKEAVDLFSMLVRQLEELLDLEWVPGVVRVCWETANFTVLPFRGVLDELDIEVLLPGILALIYGVSASAR